MNNIRIIFRNHSKNQPPTVIQCSLKEKVFEAIEKYRVESGDYESAKFIYNAKVLNPSFTLEEEHLINNANIFALRIGINKKKY